MMRRFIILIYLALSWVGASALTKIVELNVQPGLKKSVTYELNSAILRASKHKQVDDTLILKLRPGRYILKPDTRLSRNIYISNHDQNNPKMIGLNVSGLKNVVLDGSGSELICYGRMLPVAMSYCCGCGIRNLSIDFAEPHISQVTVIINDLTNGVITYRPEPWCNYSVVDGMLKFNGEGWENTPCAAIAFESDSRRIVYNTSDIGVGVKDVTMNDDGSLSAPWRNEKLVVGTKVCMRTYERPAPGIFLDQCKNTELTNVTVHYAEGMGLLAQLCENISLDGFKVSLRGDNDNRYFTTQADATHFSGCRGLIKSVGGVYENMMDDAINVHGTYLLLTDRIDEHSVEGRYMHGQSWGFPWGWEGDSVQFVFSQTMDAAPEIMTIKSIRAVDSSDSFGAKRFVVEFNEEIPSLIRPDSIKIGIENLTWTPEVIFSDNIVRNNRARGALFSTPRNVLVENNLFDHVSGCAILLCGDCNGWFETGACRDVTIRGNKIINPLTSLFQFTNAAISIYPEIPDLKNQKGYFHNGIKIENNFFDLFDTPVIYAKSVGSLLIRGNSINYNQDFKPMHWNQKQFWFERVGNVEMDNK